MCRNIKLLFNFSPPVTEEEIRAASLQFVRKVSGFNKPSKANEAAFLAAVEGITAVASNLLSALETRAQPRYREVEVARSRERFARRAPKEKGLEHIEASKDLVETKGIEPSTFALRTRRSPS